MEWKEIRLPCAAGRSATHSCQRPRISMEDIYNFASEEDESSSYAEKGNKKRYLKINVPSQCYLFLHSLFQSWLNELYQETFGLFKE